MDVRAARSGAPEADMNFLSLSLGGLEAPCSTT